MSESSLPIGDARVDPGAAGTHDAAAPSGWPFLLPVGLLLTVFGLALLQPVLLLGGVVSMAIPIVGWFRDANRELAVAQEGVAHGGEAEHGRARARSSFPGPALGLVIALIVVAGGITLSLNTKGSTLTAGGPATVASAMSGPAEVDAKNIQFSVTEIDAPANKTFEITFKNEDSVPHNIAILDSAAASKTFFRGGIVTGPASATYEVPALPAGTYYFHCDVHPGMNGTVSVK